MQFSYAAVQRTKEAKDVSGHSDIPVAIDGTWQKHGHTSLNGAVIATSAYTGKMLDASILSRSCKCPNKMHNKNCKANHFRNSGSIEISGTIEIFQRSESLHGLRYTKFLGDGDSRAYKAVNEMQPYGDIGIEKLECVGYVEKRMGTRLRALKLKMKDVEPHVLSSGWWKAPDHPQSVLPQNWGETELNRSATCMVLKATANDRCHLALYHDEFRGPLPIRWHW
ncbi:uncharacterized protein TNCV_3418021 [Trichonephila clavipes]|nr:uncharacterized protein TNCV_3418021 [Trichonephila clavipes]